VTGRDRHFACTRCGACCNRAPELELGEAGKYADTFVLQLLMRIYSLPRSVADHESELPREEANAEYFESKRLLGLFAATSWLAKVKRGARIVEYVQYLSLSVLPLDLGLGRCSALSGSSCSIYAARPLSCRSVPLHYSRPEVSAVRDLDAFTETPGFACATGADAPLVISHGGIVDLAMREARADALAQAARDASWKGALVKAMKTGSYGLPSRQTVEANAAQGALTSSMQGAWRVSEAAGAIEAGTTNRLLSAQLELIGRELARSDVSAAATTNLINLQREYRAALAS
jgi:Fe-S-cluster containining protein